MRVPNAVAFSPEGSLYFCDTRVGTIERAEPHGGRTRLGALRRRRRRTGRARRSDGRCRGPLWNARWGGGALARVAPDGSLDRLVRLPVTNPTSCAFGGPDLATLYVTTARQGLSADRLAAEPLAGSLLALDVGVAGLPEPAFAG